MSPLTTTRFQLVLLVLGFILMRDWTASTWVWAIPFVLAAIGLVAPLTRKTPEVEAENEVCFAMAVETDDSKSIIVMLGLALAMPAAALFDLLHWAPALFLSVCFAVAAKSISGESCSAALANGDRVATKGGRVFSLALHGVFLTAVFQILFWVWPHVACHPMQVPLWVGQLFADFDNMVSRISLFGVADISSINRSLAYVTRSGATALTTTRDYRKTLLLNYENLQVFTFAILALAMLARGLFLDGWKGLSRFFLVVILANTLGVFFTALLWRQVHLGTLGTEIYQHRTLSSAIVVFLWITAEWLLETKFGFSPITRLAAGLRRPIILKLPRLLSWQTAFGTFLFAFLAAQFLCDPGKAKQGRILIDETHSDWERADLPMNAEFYGVKTVYNYAFMKEILEKHFASVDINRSSIDNDVLANCDVLILKTPTKPYRPEELEAIWSFVDRGGGLWLIGDHTNIFGMNTYLNQVGRRWDLQFIADAVSPLDGYYEELVSVDGVPTLHPKCGRRDYELLASQPYLNHPVIGGHIPYCTLLTSCSVSAPIDSSAISISRGTYVDHALFGSNTFFGDLKYNADEQYGYVLQNVAIQAGYGRIATWSDSTLFSNFSMCMTGVPDLAIGYVEWLNRKNSVSTRRQAYLGIAGFTVLAFLALTALAKPGQLVFTIMVTLPTLLLMIPVFDWFNRSAYVPPDIQSGFDVVGFDQEYSVMELPNRNHVHPEDPEVFESFYIMAQRLHSLPIAADRFDQLEDSKVVVMSNPTKKVSSAHQQLLRRHLNRGGSLILMVSGKSRNSLFDAAVEHSNDLLKELGLESRFSDLGAALATDAYGPMIPESVIENFELRGVVEPSEDAEVLLQSAEGLVVSVAESRGEGEVLILSEAALISNLSLGGSASTVTLANASRLEFAVNLLDRAIPGPSRASNQIDNESPWRMLLEQFQIAEAEQDSPNVPVVRIVGDGKNEETKPSPEDSVGGEHNGH